MVFSARILLGDLHTGSLGESSLYDMGQILGQTKINGIDN